MNAYTSTKPQTKTAAEPLWFGNTLVTVNVSSRDGADGMSVIEHRMPFGDSPPLHIHRNEDEIFHVLRGDLLIQVDGKQSIVSAGQTALAPKGVPHSYRVISTSGAHVLTITSGKDFETMLRITSRPAAGDRLPVPVEPTPEMIEGLVKACAENGIDIVGAPIG